MANTTITSINATATTTDKTINLYSVNLTTGKISTKKFFADFRNVADLNYFARGLSYLNLKDVETAVEKKITSLKQTADKARKTGDIVKANMAEEHKEILQATLFVVRDLLGAINASPREKVEWGNDVFMNLVLFSVRNDHKIDLEIGNLMNTLGIYSDARHNGRELEEKYYLSVLKQELEEILLVFATSDYNGNYRNSRVNINRKMAVCVADTYYKGVVTDKSGFVVESTCTESVIKKQILAQAIGRLQGSISEQENGVETVNGEVVHTEKVNHDFTKNADETVEPFALIVA